MFEFQIDTTTGVGFSLLAAFYIIGFLHILHALMNTRTSQGTIAWVVSLLSLPFVSIPLYWLLGRSKFSGYVRARRGNDAELRKLAEDMHEGLREYSVDLPEEDVFEHAAEELGGLPFMKGNRLELLIDGKATFERLLAAIADAKNYICVNFFIVKNDKIGITFQKALIERAKAGVEVYFLFDEIGSHKLSSTYLGELRDAGVECVAFGSNRHWWSRLQLNFRNHRKIVVVDGNEAFLGGLNVGDEYLGRDKKFGDWRDTHLRMRGRQSRPCKWFSWKTGSGRRIPFRNFPGRYPPKKKTRLPGSFRQGRPILWNRGSCSLPNPRIPQESGCGSRVHTSSLTTGLCQRCNLPHSVAWMCASCCRTVQTISLYGFRVMRISSKPSPSA